MVINVSHEHRCFIWLPPKTATTRASGIFEKFGFVTLPLQNGYITRTPNKKFRHNHEMSLFHGSENYKLISTTRNPYSLMACKFKISQSDNSVDKFNQFLKKFFYRRDIDDLYKNQKYREPWDKRIPDYFIRMEYMYEDYLKLPFVKNTELFMSGELEKMCGILVNENLINKTPWKDLYDEECADMVYYNFSKHFEVIGYDRNSYKK